MNPLFQRHDPGAAGREMHNLAAMLYPICRSITGNGVRETLKAIASRIPLRMVEVKSGTPVFDWIVPKEWNIRDAYIADAQGSRLLDLRDHALHVMSYSVPVNERMPYAQLQPHLFAIPEHPDWIPYKTSYYKEDWGFCLSAKQLAKFDPAEDYQVCIDSTLDDGCLTYGEAFIQGTTSDEVLISCHVCHPSLANDNLSGIVVAAFLAGLLAQSPRRYSYRFLFLPGTIGAITWLAHNKSEVHRIRHGLVLTCLGDSGAFHYKKSRRGIAEIDRAAALVLKEKGDSAAVVDFSPYGYDERQYCSPGFNLPVGCLMRSMWGTFPEYHTSADNLSFIHADKLAESLDVCLAIVSLLESNDRYINLKPYCEPQLGKRGLYTLTGGNHSITEEINARLWVLNLSDGSNSLMDIAERSGVPFALIRAAADALEGAGLVSRISQSASVDSPLPEPVSERNVSSPEPLSVPTLL